MDKELLNIKKLNHHIDFNVKNSHQKKKKEKKMKEKERKQPLKNDNGIQRHTMF